MKSAITLLLSLFYFSTQSIAQNNLDSIINIEINSFLPKKENPSIESNNQLIEIPIYSCSDENVNFIYSPLIKNPSIYIHMYFKKNGQERFLDSIFFITHSHFQVDIPKSEFENLRQENSCNFVKASKKVTFTSDFYKAFLSEDHSRIYVYMLGETKQEKYEVVWVVVDSKFHSRKLIPLVD